MPLGPYMRCAVHESRSMPIASTFTGTFPTACVASVWKMTPLSLQSLPMAAMSWIVPISLLANITETRTVLSVIALPICSTSIRPSGCTGTYVTSEPCRSRRLATSRPARCSMTVVTMWFPFSRYISATPLRARLIDSVPPDVNTISFGSRAPISAASWLRAVSTAASASHPKGWFRLAGWPYFWVKYGSIASTTRGSAGVVDCASMKIGNVTAIASLSSLPPCLSNHFTARLAAILPAATPALLGSHYSNHFTARLAAILPAATPALLGSHYSNHFTARLAAILPAATPALLGSHYSNHFTARLAAILPAATPALLGSHYSNHFTARLAAILPAATPALLGSHYSNHFTARLAAILPAATPALLGSHYSNHFTARLAAILPAATPALLGS